MQLTITHKETKRVIVADKLGKWKKLKFGNVNGYYANVYRGGEFINNIRKDAWNIKKGG